MKTITELENDIREMQKKISRISIEMTKHRIEIYRPANLKITNYKREIEKLNKYIYDAHVRINHQRNMRK